jgi:hypothetical protein
MHDYPTCPECGAALLANENCEMHFHQMLFWEAEHPDYGAEVHHLMVLCYFVQHPTLYSQEGLHEAKQLLLGFIRDSVSPQEMRRKIRNRVDSGKRDFKITARADSKGRYDQPVKWPMTAADVTARGVDKYVESVQAWAKAAYEALITSGNL